MQEFRLLRSALPPVRFTGELLARSPERIDADLAYRGRYCTISVYRTLRPDTRLVHVHYATDHHGEHDNHLVALTQDVACYLDTLDAGEWAIHATAAERDEVRSQYWNSAAELIRSLAARQENVTMTQ